MCLRLPNSQGTGLIPAEILMKIMNIGITHKSYGKIGTLDFFISVFNKVKASLTQRTIEEEANVGENLLNV